MNDDMAYKNPQINPALVIRLHNPVFLAVLLIFVFFVFTSSYANNLPALDIPIDFVMDPHLAEKADDIDGEDYIKNSMLTLIPANPFNEPFAPIVLDPPADSYPVRKITNLNIQEKYIASLPEVRQKVEIDTRVRPTKKKKSRGCVYTDYSESCESL